MKLQEQHIYGSARLGVVKQDLEMIGAVDPSDVGEFDRVRGMKRYELTNHLGNVLTVISDRKMATVDNGVNVYYHAEIISYSDYYPFGAPMSQGTTDRTWSVEEYRFGFNGKEEDQEGMGGGLSTYDYGFRIYNPALAKFLSVDPLVHSYPWYSPFQFAGNKPIVCLDVDGLEELEYTKFLEGLQEGYKLLLEIPFPEQSEVSETPMGVWKINEGNQFWNLSGSTYTMKEGGNPSQALMDFVENPQNYTIDCAQFVQLERLYAMHNSMGSEEFDNYIDKQKGGFEIKQHNSTGVNRYQILSRRNGKLIENRSGFLKSFKERSFYNKLPIGSRLYFESTGFEPSAYNGENIIKTGRNQYNAQGIGENLTLREIKRTLKELQTPIKGKRQSVSITEVEIYKGKIKEEK